MLFSNKAASALALTTFGQSALVSSLLSPAKGDDVAGVASTKKKFELEKNHRAATEEVAEGEEEEVVAYDATAPADAVADVGRLRGARDEVLRADAPADIVVDVGLLSGGVSRTLQVCDDPSITKSNECNAIPGCQWNGGNGGQCNPKASRKACVAGTLDCACNKNQNACVDAGCDWSKDSGKGTCVEPVFECDPGDPLELPLEGICAKNPCENSVGDSGSYCDRACGYIGCGSCYTKGGFGYPCQDHRGNIGEASCLKGAFTCYKGVGNIGDRSCIYEKACYKTEIPVIEEDACVGTQACCGATVESIQEKFNDPTKTRIKAGECNGFKACCNPIASNVCACP